MSKCETCTHALEIHNEEGCRRTGCSCEGFAFTEPVAVPPQVRRITIDLPDGFMVSVSLVPYTASPESESSE